MLFAYFFAQLVKHNPNNTWGQNLFLSFVTFAGIAVIYGVIDYFKQKPESTSAPLPTEQKVKE